MRRALQPEVVDGAVAGPQTEHRAPGRKLLEGDGRRGGHGRVAGERVDDARPEADALRVQRAEGAADVHLAIERLRVGDADDVEITLLGGPAPPDELGRRIGQKCDPESYTHRGTLPQAVGPFPA